ncbi:amidohydrolase [Kineosporia rhizophila]|uniref:M20 metallopeptidase family protein n=1 Tax=Kineosporia rhizophila TaxID=84633 RepID=UPI001E5CD42B|nr:amidohydrolase [Kineosporia rhizophila]MCE0538567.1 amidohydrolase [Kineosporia rhizophila]
MRTPANPTEDGQLADILPGLLDFYRDLHAHPEIAFEEVRTTRRVAQELSGLGYRVTTSAEVTGLVASLENGAGPVVGLRADLDALPIVEQTGLPYAAPPELGAKHACGHDLHTTALLGVARLLAATRQDWSGTLVLIAQPAEETGTGASRLAASGLLDEHPTPSVLLGQHVGNFDAGTVRSRAGVLMAGQRNWRITLRGPGGHASVPHESANPLTAAAQLILRIQAITGFELPAGERAVITPTTVHAGQATNAIPAELTVTVCSRAFSSQTLDTIDAAVRRITAGVAATERLEHEIEVFNPFPLNVNDEATLARVQAVLEQEFGTYEEMPPMLGSEDFGNLAAHYGIPSAFWLFGIATAPAVTSPQARSGHSPHFAPDPEQAVPFAVRALLAVTRSWLGGWPC